MPETTFQIKTGSLQLLSKLMHANYYEISKSNVYNKIPIFGEKVIYLKERMIPILPHKHLNEHRELHKSFITIFSIVSIKFFI